ncbi:hypothetical protein [Leucothrix arctica]|uniref:Uncharacterized protein n=1 Tax=Leucothrix arctica TaxID=1481894 RepID=A0A317C710_9GAMM|nr:hypothetical protein [Leucothrix arctica]PWQ94099.1 hypothetical protein DKT75_16295 [Leucothrix arctica]
MIQGKVAWNRQGNKSWSTGNIQNLCKGTPNPQATVSCFSNGIKAHGNWQQALNTCKANGQSQPATQPTRLFQNNNKSVSFVKMHGAFSCKQDIEQVRKDGCSVPKEWKGVNIDWAYKDNNYNTFASACNSHDVCYSSPWELKGKTGGQRHCDADFKRDLMTICDRKYGLNNKRPDNLIGDIFGGIADVVEEANPELIACRVTAESMYGAVRNHGASAFRGGQTWSKTNCVK